MQPTLAPCCSRVPEPTIPASTAVLNYAKGQWTNALSSSSPMEPLCPPERGFLLGNQTPKPAEPKAAGKGSKHCIWIERSTPTPTHEFPPSPVYSETTSTYGPSVTAHTAHLLKFRTPAFQISLPTSITTEFSVVHSTLPSMWHIRSNAIQNTRMVSKDFRVHG